MRCLLLESQAVSDPFVDLKAYATEAGCKSPKVQGGLGVLTFSLGPRDSTFADLMQEQCEWYG